MNPELMEFSLKTLATTMLVIKVGCQKYYEPKQSE